MTEPIFTLQNAWAGGSYDLAVEIGPRNDARLIRALHAVWTHPDLEGCYQHGDREPNQQPRVDPSLAEDRLHGIARIGSRAAIASHTVVIRFENGADWLHFCLPMGSLGRIFDVGAFPFGGEAALGWRSELDGWLCSLGRRVFEAAPFQLAVIGWDGGELDDADRYASSGVPDERWVGYLVPTGADLKWFAPNRGAPFTFPARV